MVVGHLPGDLLAGHVQLHVQPHDLLLHESEVNHYIFYSSTADLSHCDTPSCQNGLKGVMNYKFSLNIILLVSKHKNK